MEQGEVEGIEKQEESEGRVELIHVGTLSPCHLLSRQSLVNLKESGGTS